MAKIDNYVTFVKEQVAVQSKLARKYDEDGYRSGLHQKTAANFSDLARFLEEIQKKGTEDTSYLNRGDSPLKRIQLTFEEVAGLPEDFLKELNLSEADRQELLIEYIIAQAGGVQSLDKIMIELFNRTKEIPRRNTITSRLFRMAARGMIYNVPGKKGVYSTFELSEAEAKKMFGQFDGEAPEESPTTTSPPAALPPPPAAPTELKAESGAERFKRKFMNSTTGGLR